MVRTAATAVRTGGAKSTKGVATMGGSSGGSSTGSKSRRFIGGNKPINRPIPDWQKPISNFFGRNEIVVVQPTTYDHEEQEEVNVLDPPDWQKPVSDFFVNKGSTKEDDAEAHVSENLNIDQPVEAIKSESEADEEESNPCSSGESSKRVFDTVTQDEEDENPAKRIRVPINYKLLEEYEDC